jgi:PAT family beta-lactamase induction signal transducer AmpG
MMQHQKKLGLLGSLYLSQFMPFWFFFNALPVVLRQRGLPLEAIGLLPLVLLPVTLKFLWSPLIDRYGFTRWGHYRFWIIVFHLTVVSLTLFCGSLSLDTQLPFILVGIMVMAIACGSQDIATDALALGLLEPQERGFGNAIQAVGGSLGSMIGGGAMLILLNQRGWAASSWTLALIMLIALVPILLHREIVDRNSVQSTESSAQSILGAYLKIFIQFCQRPGMRIWLLVLALFTVGHNLSVTMFRPLLVDIGLSLADIGTLLGIFGTSVTILGSLTAGVLVTRIGRRRSLLLAVCLSLLGTLCYFFPTWGFTQPAVLYLVISIPSFSLGLLSTTAFTIIMDKSRLEMAATDSTIQTSIIPLGAILSAPLSGAVAGATGYQGVFILSTISIGCCLFLIIKYLHLPSLKRQQEDYYHAHH